MSEQEEDRDQAIAARARQLFSEGVQGLDGETRSKLAQARAKAVEAAVSGRRYWLPTPATLVPLGGVAAAALAVALIWQNPATTPASTQVAVLNDLDILAEGENFDLLQDLEFYAWLLEQEEILEGSDTTDGSG